LVPAGKIRRKVVSISRRDVRRVDMKNITLWVVQVVLAGLFLFAGGMKLVAPIEMLTAQMPLPEVFVRFIGVCEVAGALGLVLPGLLRIRTDLTPLAAKGLVILMAGATMFTPPDQIALGAVPAAVGLLALAVALGRERVAPLPSTWRRAPQARKQLQAA
jgi:DoxX-like family